MRIIVTRIQYRLAALEFCIEPLDQFLAIFHVFSATDGPIRKPPAIQQLFLRDVAKVFQAPVDGDGFSVFVVSVCEPQPSANAGAVAKIIIRAARTTKRFMAGLQQVTSCLRCPALIRSLRLHSLIRILGEYS